MLAGIYRDRLIVQQRTTTEQATGVTEQWHDVRTLWGRVLTVDARARVEYQQLHGTVTHRVLFPEAVELTVADHRLLWANRGNVQLRVAAPPTDPDGTGRATSVLARAE